MILKTSLLDKQCLLGVGQYFFEIVEYHYLYNIYYLNYITLNITLLYEIFLKMLSTGWCQLC